MNPLSIISPLKWMHFVGVGRPSQEEKGEWTWNSFDFRFCGGETASFPALCQHEHSLHCPPLLHRFRLGLSMAASHPGQGLRPGLGVTISYLLKTMPWDVALWFRVRTLTVFAKVMILSGAQGFSSICMVYFPPFWGFLSNNTRNLTSK